MIAVIADDFTGASEIGGVGIRHGYDVIIDTRIVKNVKTDILIIATDTRSQDLDESQVLIEKITSELLLLQPEFIYKKFDSILRGNVGEELLVQLKASRMQRALLIPANPGLNRTIIDGIYYYNGIPLNESSFSKGEFDKRASSKVVDLMGETARSFTTIISANDILPEKGLIVGNTSKANDLAVWVKKIDSYTLPSGGSSFFDAILQAKSNSNTKNQEPLVLGKKVLYVCGSAFMPSRKLVQQARQSGQLVVYMPNNIFCNSENNLNALTQWADEIIHGLDQRCKVIVAVDKIECDEISNLSIKILEAVAEVIERVLKARNIDELLIEGGATAYSIIKKLNYTRFYPTQELGPGAIRMKIKENKNTYLTLKPGSYNWPPSIWQY